MSYKFFRDRRREVVSQPLWDTWLHAIGGTVPAVWFQAPLGTLDNLAGAAKTLWMTNMKLAGQLPSPQNYFVWSIRYEVYPTAIGAKLPDLDEIWELYWGTGNFIVGAKTALEFPFTYATAGYGVVPYISQANAGAAAAADNITHTHGQPGHHAVWRLAQPVIMEPNENWRIEATWPVLPTPSVAASAKITLDGQMVRSVQ